MIFNFNDVPDLNGDYTFTLSSWEALCKGRKGTLYIIKAYNDSETFLKVGRTCTTLKNRFFELPYSFDTVYIIQQSPKRIYNQENVLHHILKDEGYAYSPKEQFSGNSECYSMDALHLLSELLDIQFDEKKI